MNGQENVISGRKLQNIAGSAGFFDQLRALYADMDRAYDAATAAYGFSCAGCTDNCCRTRFAHHTHVEYLYLLAGFDALAQQTRTGIRKRAAEYAREMEAADATGQTLRLMCPLNEGGLCLLYAHRPMICRLHGVPHEFSPPGRGRVYGAGCVQFESQCGHQPYQRFDRTPFYMKMADLEKRFKESAGISDKIKLTVAQMLLATEMPRR
ncbi:MAG: hypothetical protein ACQERN_03920 [Thermodesulfobacteriota bacterium]